MCESLTWLRWIQLADGALFWGVCAGPEEKHLKTSQNDDALPNALAITHPQGSGKNKRLQERPISSPTAGCPPLPAQACGCPLSVDKDSTKTNAFHGSWSLSLDRDQTTSLLGFPACKWQILRLPMMQPTGFLLSSDLYALLASPLWTKCVNCTYTCGTHFCARILPT